MSRQRARRALGLGGWLAAGAIGALTLVVLGSLLLGQRPVVVLSGSMEPAFSPGDVLIERGIEASAVEVGQVVTFDEPGSERLLTHRVREVEVRGEEIVFVTKGDADNSAERWSIARDGTLGQPLWLIPAVGHVVIAAKSPLGLIGLVMLPLLALGAWEIAAIWRPRETGGERAGTGDAHA